MLLCLGQGVTGLQPKHCLGSPDHTVTVQLYHSVIFHPAQNLFKVSVARSQYLYS